MEYLLKNGPPRVAQDLRADMFKLQSLMSFSYHEDNQDKGHAIRDKAILLQDLVTQPQRLETEREQAKQYRDKFYPGSTASAYSGGGGGSYGGSSSYDSYGGGGGSMSGYNGGSFPMSMGSQGNSNSSSGYGGYGQKGKDGENIGVLGVAA